MATFTYTDSQERDYVLESGNVHCVPGETYEFDAGDGRFAPVKAPQVDSEPVTTRVREGDV